MMQALFLFAVFVHAHLRLGEGEAPEAYGRHNVTNTHWPPWGKGQNQPMPQKVTVLDTPPDKVAVVNMLVTKNIAFWAGLMSSHHELTELGFKGDHIMMVRNGSLAPEEKTRTQSICDQIGVKVVFFDGTALDDIMKSCPTCNDNLYGIYGFDLEAHLPGYEKIILVDFDILFAAPFDDVFQYPSVAMVPWSFEKPGNYNGGVVVVSPKEVDFSCMLEQVRVAAEESKTTKFVDDHLGDQVFEFWMLTKGVCDLSFYELPKRFNFRSADLQKPRDRLGEWTVENRPDFADNNRAIIHFSVQKPYRDFDGIMNLNKDAPVVPFICKYMSEYEAEFKKHSSAFAPARGTFVRDLSADFVDTFVGSDDVAARMKTWRQDHC